MKAVLMNQNELLVLDVDAALMAPRLLHHWNKDKFVQIKVGAQLIHFVCNSLFFASRMKEADVRCFYIPFKNLRIILLCKKPKNSIFLSVFSSLRGKRAY